MTKIYSRFLLGLVGVLCSICSLAQVSVTATAGTAGPTTYTTLKAAFDAINAGTHQGAIMLSITGNTTETATAKLNGNATPASYTSVLIRPTVTATVSGDIAGPLVDLNGASNVTIDGRVNSTGTTRSLTLQNISTSSNASTSTTRFINSANNNTVTYTTVLGSSTVGTDAAATILIDSSLTGGGNANITISNNDIGPAGTNLPGIAIYSLGESGALSNSAITITGNLIHDFFAAAGLSTGILADIFSTGWTISNNHFYQSAARTSTANILHANIFLNDGTGHIVSGNFIGGSAANAGGAATTISGAFSNRYHGILLDVGSGTTATAIDGNTITNLNISSTPAASANVFAGIEVDGGLVTIGNTTGNTIGSLTGTGAILLNISGANTTFNDGIVSFSTGAVSIRNNKIGSITASGSTTGTVVLRGIESYSSSAAVIDGNTIGGTTANSIQANTANNQMGGVFSYPDAAAATTVVNNNIIRNITNNATGTNSAIVYGVSIQINASAIQVVNTVTNNQISFLSAPGATATAGSIVGVLTGNGSTTNSFADGNYNNNTITNLSSGSTSTSFAVRGIQNGSFYNNFLNINGNTIHTLSSAALNTANTSAGVVQGIASSSAAAGAVNINGNTIYNLEATGNVATHVMAIGAFYASNTNSTTISKNKIYDLRNPNASATGQVSGLVLRGSGGTGTFNVNNNMISLSPANVSVFGIQNNAAATAINAYFNSVYIGGTGTGTNSSAAFLRLGALATAIDIKDNIFYNVRTGGTGGHVAVANTHTTPATAWTSNYNNLYASTASTIAVWGTTANDLNTYKTNAGDANSKSVTVTFVAPATGDLHLSGASLTDANLNGTPIAGITTDFDNDTRDATTPKMGADETASVCVAPGITTAPAAVTACTGSAATFTVVASGSGLSYQWQRNGTNITGATNATYTINAAAAGDAGNYAVVITNACGNITSTPVALTVNAGPVITTQPVAQAQCMGGTATFTVAATGTGLTYQWRKNGTDIAGATNATLTLNNLAAGDAANYSVLVSSGTCSLASNAVALTVNGAPAITTQPVASTRCFTQTATFTVAASGTGLTYQWKKNGTDIAGATAATLTLNNIADADAANYAVVVTGPCGSVTSNTVALTVTACTSVPNVDTDVASVKLMPNAVRHATVIRVNAVRSMKIQFNIVDMSGRVVMTLDEQVHAGQNDIRVELGHLSAGTYQVTGETGKGRTETLRLIRF